MPVLVKFSKDWGDEFDVDGFKIFNSEADWLRTKGDLSEHSYMFGTNEGWDEGEFDEDDFTVEEISKEEAMTIRKVIGNSFGHFPFHN
jgi:hypothetical protein